MYDYFTCINELKKNFKIFFIKIGLSVDGNFVNILTYTKLVYTRLQNQFGNYFYPNIFSNNKLLFSEIIQFFDIRDIPERNPPYFGTF